MTVFIGGTLAQQRRTGTSDFPMWSTMASISTLLIAMPLTLVSGLIGDQSTITLSVVVILTIFSGLWLFLSQSRGEV
jgi:hypothetical protein